MAIQIGRLQKVGFAKRGTLPTSPIVAGTFNTPTQMVRFIPPFAWDPDITPGESAAIDGTPELPNKAVKLAAQLQALKCATEMEPGDVLGNQLMALFGLDTQSGSPPTSAKAHNFERLVSALLPSYDWWVTTTTKQKGFAACVAGKGSFIFAKQEMVRLETEWYGLNYVDALALSPTGDFEVYRPFTFAQVDAKLGGASVKNLGSAKINIDNMVQVGHGLRSDTNYGMFSWSEGQKVDYEVEQYFEDATEYNKFLAASSPDTLSTTSLNLKVTSPEGFSTPTGFFSLELYLPKAFYRKAETQLPGGIVLFTANGGALKDTGSIGSGGNAYTIATAKSLVAQWINNDVTAY